MFIKLSYSFCHSGLCYYLSHNTTPTYTQHSQKNSCSQPPVVRGYSAGRELTHCTRQVPQKKTVCWYWYETNLIVTENALKHEAQAWIKRRKYVCCVIFPSVTWENGNMLVSGTKTHLAAFLAFYPIERHSRKRVKSEKSLWGEEEMLSQFVSSPIHVLLCSLSSFSPFQSVSNKLFSLFLSLHWLLRCLFLYSSEHHSLLLVWAISTGLLCACVSVLGLLRAPGALRLA